MAQIRKFSDGGQSKKEKVRTIKRGPDEVSVNDLVRKAENNIDAWLKSRDLSDQEKEGVLNAYRDLINQVNEGTIRPKLGGEWEFDEKPREERAYQIALGYLTEALNKTNTYKAPADPAKEKLNSNDISALVNQYLFNGNDFNNDWLYLDDYNEELGARGTSNRISKLSNALTQIKADLDKYDIDDSKKQQLIAGIDSVLTDVFADGKITDNERLALSRLGINPDQYFSTRREWDVKEDSEKTEDELLQERVQAAQHQAQLNQAEKLARQYELYNKYMSLEDPNLSLNLGKYSTYIPEVDNLKMSDDIKTRRENYYNDLFNTLQSWLGTHNVYEKDASYWDQKWNGRDFTNGKQMTYTKTNGQKVYEINPNLTNGQVLKFLLNQYAKRHTEEIDPGGFYNGSHIMGTYGGYSRLYDPTSERMYNIPVHKIPGLMEKLPELSMFAQYQATPTQQVESSKNGGTLKAQFGSRLDVIDHNQLKQAQLKEAAAKKEAELNAKIAESGKTKEEYLRDNKKLFGENATEWSYADIARAASIGADITSMLAAFAPGYGTAASAITGVTGTLAGVSADISEGHGWDAIKNLGIGLALDTIGLIPGFGTAGKTAKMIKAAAKLAPKLLAATTFLDSGVQNSIKKLVNDPDNITVKDWRNISIAIKAATGITSSATIGAKRSAMRKAAELAGGTTKGQSKFSIKTKNGEITVGEGEGQIPKAAFDKMQGKSLKEANAILQGIKGQENNQLKSNLIGRLPKIDAKVKSGTFRTKKGETIYDFSVLDGTKPYKIFGKEFNPFGRSDSRWSDLGIYNQHLNGSIGIMPFWNPFTWGLKKSFKSVKTKTAQITPRKAVKMLPAGKFDDKELIASQVSPQSSSIIPESRRLVAPLKQIKAGVRSRTFFDDKFKIDKTFDPQTGKEIATYNILRGSGKNKTYVQVSQQEFLKQLKRYRVRPKSNVINEFVSFVPAGSQMTLFKAGGILRNIRKFNTGGITNTQALDGYGWEPIIYGENGKMNDYFKTVLSAINKNNYKAANDLQNSFYINKINDKWDENPTYGPNETVKNYQTKFNSFYGGQLNQGAIENAITSGKIKRAGNTGDNMGGNYADGYAGAMTNLRHLGDRNAEKLLSNYNEILKQQGLEARINPETGMVNFYELDSLNTSPEKAVQQARQAQDQISRHRMSGISVNEKSNNPNDENLRWKRFGLDLADLLRLNKTLDTNKNIENTKKADPLLIDTYYRFSPVTSDLAGMNAAERAVADMKSESDKAITPDARDFIAQRALAAVNAAKIKIDASNRNNQYIEQTKQAALERQEDNMAKDNQKDMANRQSIHSTNETNKQLHADRLLSDYNAINEWWSGMLARGYQDIADQEAFLAQQNQDMTNILYQSDPDIYEARKKYSDAKTAEEKAIARDELMRLQATKLLELKNSQNQYLANLKGWPTNNYNLGFQWI